MTLKPCEKIWILFFYHELYSIKSFHLKNRDIILLKMKYLKNETETEKNFFFSRPPSFKLPKEVLKFNDIYTGWCLPKIDLETKFSNLENWECQFLSVETISADNWHSFFINLFISVIDLRNIHQRNTGVNLK